MTPDQFDPTIARWLPDHTQLPDKDGLFAKTQFEAPQSELLCTSLWPRLEQLYGNQFNVGCDSGIYWRHTIPPLDGCTAPDWHLVPGVPRMLNGRARGSYVLWQEVLKPLLVIEYVGDDSGEERDTTPYRGKFWVYERAINASFYIIFDPFAKSFDAFRLEDGRYQLLRKNGYDRIEVPPLGVEFGLWQGTFRGLTVSWLRAWDAKTDRLLLLPEEGCRLPRSGSKEAEDLAAAVRDRVEATVRADAAERRTNEVRAFRRKVELQLRELGIDPETI